MNAATVGFTPKRKKIASVLAGFAWMLLLSLDLAHSQVSRVEELQPLDGVPSSHDPEVVQAGGVYRDCALCPVMVVLPSGSYWMGSPADPGPDPFSDAKLPKMGEPNERPQHLVQIRSFAIGMFEVTQEQWHAVMGTNPSRTKGRTWPVENMSWDEAQLYVQKLSQQTGQRYRLPSEAEWEYASRAGSSTIYPWGENDHLLHVHAWFNSIAHAPNPVGMKNPNPFGLHDMVGNVAEWTQDCWHDHFKGAPQDGSAWTSGRCSLKTVRGGSWNDGPSDLRSAKRLGIPKDFSGNTLGLRVVREL